MKCEIQFANEKVKEAFENLGNKNNEEKQLKKFIERAFEDLCENPFCGIQIPKKLIPREYLTKYNVKNTWKYNLPGAWRLIYSVENTGVVVLSIILEWLDHKSYERRFNY